MHLLFNWFLHVTGSDNTSGVWYGFWSGFGSDLGEITIIGAVVTGFRHINCNTRGCLRIGKFPVQGTSYKTCHKHTTEEDHNDLSDKHDLEYPEQHKFLRRKK